MSKRIFGLIFITLISIWALGSISFAAPPPKPTNFVANYPVHNPNPNIDEHTITLSWAAAPGAEFYIIQIDSDQNWAGQKISEEKTVTGTTYTETRTNSDSNPVSGTVFRYKLYAGSYLKDGDGNKVTPEVIEKSDYAQVAVLTDAKAEATPLGTSQVELKWDDVKYGGKSISWDIARKKKGVPVGQEQIKESEIGQTAKRVDGKLVYTVSNLDQSTEYTFSLVPKLDPTVIKFNPSVDVKAATKISAIIQRYNESIMKLLWDEYQGDISSTQMYYKVLDITTVNGLKSSVVIAMPTVTYYFIQIDTSVDHSYKVQVFNKNDNSFIAESEELSLKDIGIPASPVIPNLQSTIGNTNIDLMWDAYKNVDDSLDTGVRFDVWFMTDPKGLGSVRAFYKSGGTDGRIAKDVKIINGVSTDPKLTLVTVNGKSTFKYALTGLTPNTTYYVGVVAKKDYLTQDPNDPDNIINITYNSEPAMGTLKTTSGNLEQPVALVKPTSLAVKMDNQGKTLVTQDSITIKWPMGQTVSGTFIPYYQNDIYFKVGYEKYSTAFDKNKTNDPADTEYNIKTDGVTITKDVQETTAEITKLDSNTQYVIWIKAYRDIPGDPVVTRVSEAADPIIVVTLPEYTTPDVKPPVPVLNILDYQFYNKVTLQFNSLAGLKYTIAWGKEDSVAKKISQKEYTASSSLSPDSVVIDELDPESTYYFWVMATSGKLDSEWSDSIIGRTIPIPPPNPPYGFGVKKMIQNGEFVPDIGEHHIMLQWDKVDKREYTLEVSKKDDFSDSEKIEAGAVGEYKLEKFKGDELRSNTRFWIRIFATDTDTKKTSQSSPYLTVKTKINYDEYDSSKDIETPITGKVAKEVIDGTKGVWNVDLTGPGGDRLIEKLRTQASPDYNLDLSQTSVTGINTREVAVSDKVMDALTDTSQNLIIKSSKAEFIFLPGSFDLDELKNMARGSGEDIQIKINLKVTTPAASENNERYQMLSDINALEVTAVTSETEKKITKFARPIKIRLSYTDNNSNGVVDSYFIGYGSGEWVRIPNNKFKAGEEFYLTLNNDGAGKFSVRKQYPDSKQVGLYVYKNEIDKLLVTGILKSVDPDSIRPTKSVTLGDAVKMLLDSAEVEYDGNFMDIASKSGFLSALSDLNPSREISKEEAVSMVIRMYEIRTGMMLPEAAVAKNYEDYSDVSKLYESYVGNALKMKILIPISTFIRPKDSMTRGEMIVLTKRLLETLGKL